jgi:hypothetical protein
MNPLNLSELQLADLDGRSHHMNEIVRRTTLLVFLRHLA